MFASKIVDKIIPESTSIKLVTRLQHQVHFIFTVAVAGRVVMGQDSSDLQLIR